MTPTEFLNDAPKDFKCDLHENDKVYTVSFSQLRETKNCLYYIGELGLSNKDFYVAPLYIFKQKSKFANGMMKIVPFVEEEAWSIISGAHFHHQFKDRLREGQRCPRPVSWSAFQSLLWFRSLRFHLHGGRLMGLDTDSVGQRSDMAHSYGARTTGFLMGAWIK